MPWPLRISYAEAGSFARCSAKVRSAMRLGYARVSTDDQSLDHQRERLREAGCERLFEEKVSGARRDRPELARLLDQLRGDDVVVVTRLDRLARSTSDLLEIAEAIRAKEAGLLSLAEPWADTTPPAGRMVPTVFAGIAEFERELIRQRTDKGRLHAPTASRPLCGGQEGLGLHDPSRRGYDGTEHREDTDADRTLAPRRGCRQRRRPRRYAGPRLPLPAGDGEDRQGP